MSTHRIHQPGIARLKCWGLRDRLVDTGCPATTTITMDLGPFALWGTPPPAGSVAEAYCPRRTNLDKILVDAAVEAGAELREGFSVHDLLWEGDRVIGIAGAASGGLDVKEQAQIVIGADGIHSLVARKVAATMYNTKPTYSCYYSYWSGVPVEGIEFYMRENRGIGVLPTYDSLACLTVGWPRDEFEAFRADIEGNYLKTLELAPGLAERVRPGKREERFIGTAELYNSFRKACGPGWALVGDAGYHKDPVIVLAGVAIEKSRWAKCLMYQQRVYDMMRSAIGCCKCGNTVKE